MKTIFLLILIAAVTCSYSQTAVSGSDGPGTKEKVSFTVKFDKNTLTKDGYYLNGYVVQITEKQAEKYHGQTIKISGVVSTVKGLDSRPKEYDDQGNEIIYQGRDGDTSYILAPKIKIVK